MLDPQYGERGYLKADTIIYTRTMSSNIGRVYINMHLSINSFKRGKVNEMLYG